MEAIHHKEFKGYTPAPLFMVTLPDLRLPSVPDLLQVSSVWLMFVTVHYAPTVTVPFQRTTAQKSGISSATSKKYGESPTQSVLYIILNGDVNTHKVLYFNELAVWITEWRKSNTVQFWGEISKQWIDMQTFIWPRRNTLITFRDNGYHISPVNNFFSEIYELLLDKLAENWLFLTYRQLTKMLTCSW